MTSLRPASGDPSRRSVAAMVEDATEGGRAGVRYGFEHLGLERIIAITVPQHVVSQRIMRKCGLTYQGIVQLDDPRTRRKRDIVWYAIDRSRRELHPEP